MVDWNSAQYLKFEEERTRPGIDLLTRVTLESPKECVDIGCGPGNSTELLLKRFPQATVTGLDHSPGMLTAAKLRLPGVTFERIDLNHWTPMRPFDLIFANAILQSLPDHHVLLPRLVSLLSDGGCLAAQMPDNLQEPAHALMRMIAAEEPWRTRLLPVAKTRTRIGTLPEYYKILAASCRSLELWHTTYVHPLESASEIVEWMKGSGLGPFLAPLDPDERQSFLEDYEAQIRAAYPRQTDGKVLLYFPRLFIIARRGL